MIRRAAFFLALTLATPTVIFASKQIGNEKHIVVPDMEPVPLCPPSSPNCPVGGR